MKVLYLDTLRSRRRTLSDHITQPHQLHSQLCNDWNSAGESRGEDHVLEASQMSLQHSLALFIHRLRVLVPLATHSDPERAAREIKNKSLGAELCLDRLLELGVTCPHSNFTFSQESNALECLVKCYVNLTQRQRYELKQELAGKVTMSGEDSTIFELVAQLFAKQGRSDRCAGAVGVFVSSMEQAQVPRLAYVELQHNLSSAAVPHNKINIPGEQ